MFFVPLFCPDFVTQPTIWDSFYANPLTRKTIDFSKTLMYIVQSLKPHVKYYRRKAD